MSDFHVGRVVRRMSFLSLVMLSFTLMAFGQGNLGDGLGSVLIL